MSELERPEHGAITESPTLLPGHGAGTSERVEEKQEIQVEETPPAVTAEPNGSAPAGATDRPPLLDENGLPKKRRRRGSRGGRGRKKPGTGAAGGGSTAGSGTGNAARVASPSDDSRASSGGQDWTDAAAPR